MNALMARMERAMEKKTKSYKEFFAEEEKERE
jgi:hypothetical protein